MHAFEDWYRQAYPGLVESIVRAVGDRALGVDAADEAAARAFERWERVAAMRSPNGWVYRVAVNVAKRHMARTGRDADAAILALAGRPAVAPPPGNEAWLLVPTLPLRQRTAIVLRHAAGLTEAGIAEAMGVTRSTVSSTLASAHDNLRRKLMTIELGLARRCHEQGCDVEDLATGALRPARWSDAVRNTIKVRPGDLVAVEDDEVVWRWWHGRVVSAAGDAAVVRRRVTRGDADEADMEIAVPAELAGDVAAGMTAYWHEKTLVAVAERELTQPPPGVRPSSDRR